MMDKWAYAFLGFALANVHLGDFVHTAIWCQRDAGIARGHFDLKSSQTVDSDLSPLSLIYRERNIDTNNKPNAINLLVTDQS